MTYRAMSPDKAIQQFEALFKHAPRCTRYWCVDNILAKNYISEVFPFFINFKVDVLRDSMPG